MLRVLAIVAVLAAFPAASSAARRADAPVPNYNLVAKVVNCDVAGANDRAATFFGRMDTIAPGLKMQIRFQLFERLGAGAAWNKLDVPALRQWNTSAAGVKRFAWKQTVDGLHAGGAYKVRIQYRWVTATGSVLDTEQRDSPICRGPLPNIGVGGLETRSGPTADTRVYRVEVDNLGKVDADQVDVSLAVDRAVLDTITIGHLAAGDSRTVSFTGPACQRSVRVMVDPGNSIGETIENDNSQLFACS